MNELENISTYYLLLELTDGGHTGLLPKLEPIDLDDIFLELNRRTGLDFDKSIQEWSSWFLKDTEHGTELERANFHISLKTAKMMEKIWGSMNVSE